jgi:hypothetical protein
MKRHAQGTPYPYPNRRSSQLGYRFGGSKCEATARSDRRFVGDGKRAVEVKKIARAESRMCKADGRVGNPKRVVLSERFLRDLEERAASPGETP